jgi:hypothetical protein
MVLIVNLAETDIISLVETNISFFLPLTFP